MYCVPFNGSPSLTLRRLIFLVIVLLEDLSSGTAADSTYKYGYGPLPSSLSGRPALESNSASNNVGKTIIAGRAVSAADTIPGGITGSADNAGAEGGGGGEILVPKTFPLSSQEPTCEQLRAMWIFSKRQSRAAEITNEIPTYRDPFAYNVWEPFYSTTRSLGAVRMVPRFGERSRLPVFGRVISKEPLLPQRLNIGQRQRHIGASALNTDGSQTRFFGAEVKPLPMASNGRRTSQYRYIGSNGGAGSSGNGGGQTNSVAVQGSFQKLKELIWTERAKELTQQRRAEELAARAAVLKEIANGQNIQAHFKPDQTSESYLMDENRSPDRDRYELMNDDQRTESIASGQSQILDAIQDKKKQQSSNLKSMGTPRSYNSKSQKSSSTFSSTIGGHTGRHILPSLKASSYTYDDIGVPKSYPLRPSHFRERNRSLFKQHSPSEYFQRDARQKGTSGIEKAKMSENLIFERLISELNQRLMEKQHEHNIEGRNEEGLQAVDNQSWLDEQPYTLLDYGNQYAGTQDINEYF